MRNVLVTVAAVAAVLSIMAASAYASVSTQDFVHKASIANEFEIESSKLALEKSQNNDVKAFAKRMIHDHTEAGEKLKATLESAKSDAQASDTLDAGHRHLMEQLHAASGDAFNRKYISMQTDAHKQAVALFSDYSKYGKNPALKNFAAQLLPTLKDHLKHVEHLKAAE